MKITWGLFLLFLIGYFAGVFYPSLGQTTVSKLQGAAG